MFNENQIKILEEELNSNRIKTREKGNVTLSYIEGFDVIDTANHIFGFGNWSYNISKLEQVSQEINQKQNVVVCYKAIVEVSVHNKDHVQGVTREDVGFGTGIAKTLADAHEGGAKEAITDAIKRSLRSFGNQFGNSLYSKDKIHNTNQQNNYQSTQTQIPANNRNQQQYNQLGNNQSNNQGRPAANQQDFIQLTNLGLVIMQKGDSLIVVGDNVFANKEIIKSHGFRWDGASKTWYLPLREVA